MRLRFQLGSYTLIRLLGRGRYKFFIADRNVKLWLPEGIDKLRLPPFDVWIDLSNFESACIVCRHSLHEPDFWQHLVVLKVRVVGD